MTPNTLRSPFQDHARAGAAVPSAPRFEHHEEPFGIGEDRPRLSWQVTTDRTGWVQAAYELQLGPDEASLTSYGRTETREQLLQPWPAPPLESRQRVAVRVRVWGNDRDAPSEWSPVAYVEAGLLNASDWQAAMIRPAWDEASDANEPAARLSRTFEVAGPVASALQPQRNPSVACSTLVERSRCAELLIGRCP